MIPIMSDFKTLTIQLRKVLIKASQLNSNRVINALSMYGPELIKYVNDLDIYESYEPTDVVIIFEINSNPKDYDFTMEESDCYSSVNSYTCHLYIYGNTSLQMATNLKMRFESNPIGDELWAQGIYVESVSNPETTNEYINESMWSRSDLEINFSVSYQTEKMDDYYVYENINEQKIIKKN